MPYTHDKEPQMNNNDSHDEKTCPGLHLHLAYTVIVFKRSRGAENLIHWYNAVFSRQNPNNIQDFDMEMVTHEGEEFLEITQHTEMFAFSALLAMFEGYEAGNADVGVLKTGKVDKGPVFNWNYYSFYHSSWPYSNVLRLNSDQMYQNNQ